MCGAISLTIIISVVNAYVSLYGISADTSLNVLASVLLDATRLGTIYFLVTKFVNVNQILNTFGFKLTDLLS